MTSAKKAPKPSRSFATYIQKVLKQIHPDGGMSLQSMDTVDSILRYFAKLFARDARLLALDNDTKTISSREINTAVNLLFTKELASNAAAAGQKALDNYLLFESNRTSDKNSESSSTMKAPKTMKQTKAGLLCSVSLVESHLRYQGVNVGQGAPVYLAAVLEYLAAEILELSGLRARENKRTRIKVCDIYNAVENDPELHDLFQQNHLVLLGGGSVPNIDHRIIEAHETKSAKKLSRKAGTGTDGSVVKNPHRYRPGTVALREIRQQQKSNRLRLCKVHVQKACKTVIEEHNDSGKQIMMSQEARVAIHYVVEQNIVAMFREANEWCLHADRTTLSERDLQMAIRKVDVVEGSGESLLFTQPPITLLARRAGVYRMGGNVWKIMKDYIHFLLSKYLSSSVTILRHQCRQSINLKVLSESMSTCHDMNLCVIPRKIRRSKRSDETDNTDGDVTDDDVEEDVQDDLVDEDDLDDDEVDDEEVEDVEDEDVEDEVVEEVKVSKPTKNSGNGKTSPPKRALRSRVRATK